MGETRADMRVSVTVGSEAVFEGMLPRCRIWAETSFQLGRQQCAIPCVEQEQQGMRRRKEPPFQMSFAPEPTADSLITAGRKHRVAT